MTLCVARHTQESATPLGQLLVERWRAANLSGIVGDKAVYLVALGLRLLGSERPPARLAGSLR